MNRIFCGLVTNHFVNKTVLVKGWVKKVRKLGKLLFIDLSDCTGMIQIVVSEDNSFFATAKNLKRESVVAIKGNVCQRKNINHEINNGDIELELVDLKIYTIADTTPLIVENETDALEEVRMSYRYLDLRRPIIQKNLFFRSQVLHHIRNFLANHYFQEVETPILGKPSPEGARDYLVPSRIHHGNFYALPQSPQIYKQLLMVAGFERYYQIAKCFRDEDLRSDRQPEFTQLDMELSFTDELEVQTLVEQLLKDVFKKTLNVDLTIPFPRMPYKIAMQEYGSDKPDLRFGLKIIDASQEFKSTSSVLFNINETKVIKCLVCEQLLNKKDVAELEKYAKDMGAKGLAWVSYDGQMLQGSITKLVELATVKAFLKKQNLSSGTILLVVDNNDIAVTALGAVRINLAKKLNLIPANSYAFVWITEWPLFEYDVDNNKYVAAHHPFTQPQDKYHDSFDKEPGKAFAKAYDIVLNGYELGGGSIRIIDPNMQDRMFKLLGLSENEINNKFGYLIEAFKYGVPPHGGLAIGVDRLITLMLGLTNIKDVIAFPKNASAYDQMLHCPSDVTQVELDTLNIQIKEKSNNEN